MSSEGRSPLLASVVLTLSALLLFGSLGRRSFENKDISRTAEIARETLHEGRWLAPTREGELETEKPPLYIWLVAGVGAATGRVGPLESRLPAAISSFASVVLVLVWVTRRHSLDLGVRAAALLATGQAFVLLGRHSRVDSTFAFFIALAAILAFEASAAARAKRFTLAVGSGIALGLAVLTKGPLAIILHVGTVSAVLGADALLRRPPGASWARVVGSRLLEAPTWLPPVVATLVLACWLVPFWSSLTEVERAAYWRQFYYENVLRGAGLAEKAHGPLYYVPRLLGQAAPGSVLAIGLLPFLSRLREKDEATLAWTASVWWFAPFALLSLSAGKQVRYLLPCLPGLAVAGGICWLQLDRLEGRFRSLLSILGWVACGVGLVAAVGAPVASTLRAPEILGDAVWLSIAFGATAWLGRVSAARPTREAVWPILLALWLGEVAFYNVIQPSTTYDEPRSWVRRLARSLPREQPLGDVVLYQPASDPEQRQRQIRLLLALYRDEHELPRVARTPEELKSELGASRRIAVIDESHWDTLPKEAGLTVLRKLVIETEDAPRRYVLASSP